MNDDNLLYEMMAEKFGWGPPVQPPSSDPYPPITPKSKKENMIENAAVAMASEMDEDENWKAFMPLAKVAYESIMADIED